MPYDEYGEYYDDGSDYPPEEDGGGQGPDNSGIPPYYTSPYGGGPGSNYNVYGSYSNLGTPMYGVPYPSNYPSYPLPDGSYGDPGNLGSNYPGMGMPGGGPQMQVVDPQTGYPLPNPQTPYGNLYTQNQLPTMGTGYPGGGIPGGYNYQGTPSYNQNPGTPTYGLPASYGGTGGSGYPGYPGNAGPGAGPLGGQGGGPTYNNDYQPVNPYANSMYDAQAKIQAAQIEAQWRQASIAQQQQAAQQDYQARMAQVESQQHYYEGLLQNGQLDDQTKRYIADQQNQLGMYQAGLTSQYQQGLLSNQSQQNQNTYDLGMGNIGLGYFNGANSYALGQDTTGLGYYNANNSMLNNAGQMMLGYGNLGLGMGNLGVSEQQANTAQMLGLGNLGLGLYGAGTNLFGAQTSAMLGGGNLALQAQQAQAQQAQGMGNLMLQGQLGYGQLGLGAGNLGVSQYQAETQRQASDINNQLSQQRFGQVELPTSQANIDIARQQQQLATAMGYGNLGVSQEQADTGRLGQLVSMYLGGGNLQLGQQQLQETIRQAHSNEQFQRAQMAAQLQGPENAFAQQRYLHGLDQNGVSNAVGALTGQVQLPKYGANQGPVNPATLDNFQQNTGLTIPGGP